MRSILKRSAFPAKREKRQKGEALRWEHALTIPRIVSRPVWLEPCEPAGKSMSSKEAWRADHAGFVSLGKHFGFYPTGDGKLLGILSLELHD